MPQLQSKTCAQVLLCDCDISWVTSLIIIFHFLWNHWALCGIFENRVLLMYTLEGVSSVAHFIAAYEESQLNRNSHFLIRSVFFVSKTNLFDF